MEKWLRTRFAFIANSEKLEMAKFMDITTK